HEIRVLASCRQLARADALEETRRRVRRVPRLHELGEAVQRKASERAIVGHERIRGEPIRIREMDPSPSDLRADLLAPENADAEAEILALRLGAFAVAYVVDERADALHHRLGHAVEPHVALRGLRDLRHRFTLFVGERTLARDLRDRGERVIDWTRRRLR